MAIQFSCPNCASIIKVPDAYSGKRGACPKCKTSLLVPVIEVPAMVGTAASVAATSTASPTAVSMPASESTFDPVAPVLQTLEPASVARQLQTQARKRKAKSQGSWIAPVFCGAIMLGVVGFFLWNSQPKLEGQLAATPVEGYETPPGILTQSESGLKSSEWKAVLSHLTKDPPEWKSSSSNIKFIPADDLLEVRMTPGREAHWVRVDPRTNAALVQVLKDRGQDLEKTRASYLKTHAPELFSAWKAQLTNPGASFDLAKWSTTVAYPALVGGAGFHLEAVTGTTAYPCVHEDPEGRFYFLVPAALKTFTLRGRTGKGFQSLAANFTVQIGLSEQAAPKPGRRKTKEERERDNQGMNPELYRQPDSETASAEDVGKNPLSKGLGMKLTASPIGTGVERTKAKPGMGDHDLSMKPGEMMDGDAMSDGEMMDGEMMEKPASKKTKTVPKSKAAMLDKNEIMTDGEMSDEMMEKEAMDEMDKPAPKKPAPKKKATN